MTTEIIEKLSHIVENEFKDILLETPRIFPTKMRIYLKDTTFVDVHYQGRHDYSFHWQGREILRVNTSPDHKEISTFPRHIHQGEKFKNDTITSTKFSPEENLRRFLNFVRKELKKETK